MRIGPYEILSEVGRGGMGAVYRGRSPEGREVAVKVLLRVDPERLARFDRERRLLARLGEERGFVELLDAGETSAGPYLVTPYLPGGTLRDRLARGAQTIEATAELGRALGRALGEAHALGIVHRDLKPENVLFTAKGRPLVADLGIAKHFKDEDASGASASLSRGGALRGTAGYMAPEQILDAKAVGPAADVYALGAILYESLTGQPAFVGASVIELLEKVSEGRVPSVSRVRPDAPEWLARAIDRALDRDPRRRFADGLAFELALRPRVLGARGALLAGSALALGAALVGAAWASAGRRSERGPTSSPAVTPDAPAGTALFKRAEEKAHRRDLEGAIADLSSAILLSPGSSKAWVLRSQCRMSRGDFEGAIADATEAIRLEPRDATTWGARGAARGASRDHRGALGDLSEAIRLNPSDGRLRGARAATRQVLQDPEGAIADTTEALRLDPGDFVSWSLRAAVRKGLGDNEGALADATESIRLNPGFPISYRIRGGARAQLGDVPGAIADFEKFLEIAPRDAKAPSVQKELERLRAPR